jgi:hypothetical protein
MMILFIVWILVDCLSGQSWRQIGVLLGVYGVHCVGEQWPPRAEAVTSTNNEYMLMFQIEPSVAMRSCLRLPQISARCESGVCDLQHM